MWAIEFIFLHKNRKWQKLNLEDRMAIWETYVFIVAIEKLIVYFHSQTACVHLRTNLINSHTANSCWNLSGTHVRAFTRQVHEPISDSVRAGDVHRSSVKPYNAVRRWAAIMPEWTQLAHMYEAAAPLPIVACAALCGRGCWYLRPKLALT